MITVSEFMKVINYRITGGSEYQWNCYGANARYLDSDSETYSASIIFDSHLSDESSIVYEATVCDYVNNRAYRLINPLFKKQMIDEAADKEVEPIFAWDAIKFIDLEWDKDWLEKATAIVAGTEYDERVAVSIDLADDELLRLMTIAHERDITLNQLVEEILWAEINRFKSENKTPKIKANKSNKKKSKKKNKSCDIHCGNHACDAGCIASHF